MRIHLDGDGFIPGPLVGMQLTDNSLLVFESSKGLPFNLMLGFDSTPPTIDSSNVIRNVAAPETALDVIVTISDIVS